MKITARQLGRIEAACYGLAEFTKNNSVATTLVNTIREQLDEVMQPEKYVGRAPQQVTEYLDEVVRPVLDANKDVLGEKAEINV